MKHIRLLRHDCNVLQNMYASQPKSTVGTVAYIAPEVSAPAILCRDWCVTRTPSSEGCRKGPGLASGHIPKQKWLSRLRPRRC
jgi:hypothetical protein